MKINRLLLHVPFNIATTTQRWFHSTYSLQRLQDPSHERGLCARYNFHSLRKEEKQMYELASTNEGTAIVDQMNGQLPNLEENIFCYVVLETVKKWWMFHWRQTTRGGFIQIQELNMKEKRAYEDRTHCLWIREVCIFLTATTNICRLHLRQ